MKDGVGPGLGIIVYRKRRHIDIRSRLCSGLIASLSLNLCSSCYFRFSFWVCYECVLLLWLKKTQEKSQFWTSGSAVGIGI